jgi:hypothetical protein
VVILKHSAFESELYSPVLEDTCLKDPRAIRGLSSGLLSGRRGGADGPGAAI